MSAAPPIPTAALADAGGAAPVRPRRPRPRPAWPDGPSPPRAAERGELGAGGFGRPGARQGVVGRQPTPGLVVAGGSDPACCVQPRRLPPAVGLHAPDAPRLHRQRSRLPPNPLHGPAAVLHAQPDDGDDLRGDGAAVCYQTQSNNFERFNYATQGTFDLTYGPAQLRDQPCWVKRQPRVLIGYSTGSCTPDAYVADPPFVFTSVSDSVTAAPLVDRYFCLMYWYGRKNTSWPGGLFSSGSPRSAVAPTPSRSPTC